jgi:hypothetical protein
MSTPAISRRDTQSGRQFWPGDCGTGTVVGARCKLRTSEIIAHDRLWPETENRPAGPAAIGGNADVVLQHHLDHKNITDVPARPKERSGWW